MNIEPEDLAAAKERLKQNGSPEEGCEHLLLALAYLNHLGITTEGQEGALRCSKCDAMVGT
jgi:hypothetical protein